MEIKFYVCKHCGNIITYVENKGVPVMCCGEKMSVLEPNTVDASQEKHVPSILKDGNKITVEIGSVEHPMLEEHHICWICIQTKQGYQIKYLKPGEAPKAVFEVSGDDEFEHAYEFCNLHGLWKA